MIEFLTKEELEHIRTMEDGIDVVNQVLNRVYNKVYEDVVRNLPEIVGHLTTHTAKIAELRKDFYKNNPELSSHMPLVRELIERIEGENPGLAYEDVLKKVSSEAKERLLTLGKLNTENVKNPGKPETSSVLGDL